MRDNLFAFFRCSSSRRGTCIYSSKVLCFDKIEEFLCLCIGQLSFSLCGYGLLVLSVVLYHTLATMLGLVLVPKMFSLRSAYQGKLSFYKHIINI